MLSIKLACRGTKCKLLGCFLIFIPISVASWLQWIGYNALVATTRIFLVGDKGDNEGNETVLMLVPSLSSLSDNREVWGSIFLGLLPQRCIL